MQFREVNFNNLPKEAVLAYNGTDKPKIGVLLRDDETTVLCSSEQGDLLNVTHYIPLDEIKPSELKVKTYFIFISMRVYHLGIDTHASKWVYFENYENTPLNEEIEKFFVKCRQELADERGTDINKVLVTSFSCTETT